MMTRFSSFGLGDIVNSLDHGDLGWSVQGLFAFLYLFFFFFFVVWVSYSYLGLVCMADGKGVIPTRKRGNGLPFLLWDLRKLWLD